MGIEFVRDEADKQFDALALKNADPAKKYRFVRKKDIQMARAQFQGYEVVDTTIDKARSVLNDGTQVKKGSDVTTTVEVADMILMSQPKEKFEERVRRRDRKIERQISGHSRDAVDEMNRIGQGKVRAYQENTESRGMKSVDEVDFAKLEAARKGRG